MYNQDIEVLRMKVLKMTVATLLGLLRMKMLKMTAAKLLNPDHLEGFVQPLAVCRLSGMS